MRLLVENLQLIRNERRLFAGLNFALYSGDALVLSGANGAGKSSLLRALPGLLPLSHGKISFQLSSTAETPVEASLAENCHFLGMTDGLKPALTAGENLMFWGRMLAAGSSAQTIAAKIALARLNLATLEHTPVAYLSAGQRRRVALARLLSVERPVWLLDEPTNALDSASQTLFRDVCMSHLDTGGMIIAASHLDLALPKARTLSLDPTT